MIEPHHSSLIHIEIRFFAGNVGNRNVPSVPRNVFSLSDYTQVVGHQLGGQASLASLLVRAYLLHVLTAAYQEVLLLQCRLLLPIDRGGKLHVHYRIACGTRTTLFTQPTVRMTASTSNAARTHPSVVSTCLGFPSSSAFLHSDLSDPRRQPLAGTLPTSHRARRLRKRDRLGTSAVCVTIV